MKTLKKIKFNSSEFRNQVTKSSHISFYPNSPGYYVGDSFCFIDTDSNLKYYKRITKKSIVPNSPGNYNQRLVFSEYQPNSVLQLTLF